MADSLQNLVFQLLWPTHRAESAVRQFDIANVPVYGQSASILRTFPAPKEEVCDKKCALVLHDRKSHPIHFSLVCISVHSLFGSQGEFLQLVLSVVDLQLPHGQPTDKLIEGRDLQCQEVTSCWVQVVTYEEISSLSRLGKLAGAPPCLNADASEFLQILPGCFPCHVVEEECLRHGSHRFE